MPLQQPHMPKGTQYSTNALPAGTCDLNKLQEFWKSNNEQLYIGEMNRKQFEYSIVLTQVIKAVDVYLNTKLYEYPVNDEIVNIFTWKKRDPDSIFNKAFYVAKIMWLFQSFLDNDKEWLHPISSHWNPRMGDVVFHPGSARSAVFYMFGGNSTKCFYFNTLGGEVDDKMKPCVPEDLEGYKMMLTPDHGTIIPHIKIDDDVDAFWEHEQTLYWHDRIHKHLTSDISVYVNGEKWLFESLCPKKVFNVTWNKHYHSEVNMLKTFILVAAEQEWEDHTLKVTIE